MNEPDLENLRQTPVPAPAPQAKKAALLAALAAFDAQSKPNQTERKQSESEKNLGSPQGKDFTARPSDVTPLRRVASMSFFARHKQALAASLVFVTAIPVAFYAYEQRGQNPQVLQKVTDVSPAADAMAASKSPDALAPSDPAARENIPQAAPPAPPVAKSMDGPESGSNVSRQDSAKLAPSPSIQSLGAPPPMSVMSGMSGMSGMGGIGAMHNPSAAPPPIIASAPVMQKRDVLPSHAPQNTIENGVNEAEQFSDKFETRAQNPIKSVAQEPVSTFSLDVDTASYAIIRRALMQGRLPPKASVRVEEMINYFPYQYRAPESADPPFLPTVTIVPSPWSAQKKLVHVAIKGYELPAQSKPHANLVFLIDVSGSMAPQDRLPLIKNAFRLLLDELSPSDTVGIVTYASGTAVALEPTPAAQKDKILRAIDALGAGGSTAGAEGVQQAYRLAEANFDKNGVNRIILATDGDFNVGVTNENELKSFIERKRASGVYLSILGVGQNNYNDKLMQALAQNGNGVAAYVDTLNEARKILVEGASSLLFPIANDVKIQVEWNPNYVSDYRLVGYEKRALKREDFNNDKADAGDIGSGHSVTAIYEITPVGAQKASDDLRYAPKDAAEAKAPQMAQNSEYGFLKMRYKTPKETQSKLIQTPITPALEKASLNDASQDMRFSVAVAGFGQLLTGGIYLNNYRYDDVLALADSSRGEDKYGYRAEFLNLVRLAKSAQP